MAKKRRKADKMSAGDEGTDGAASGGDELCRAVDVIVDGKQAVWIFTEFETGESLEDLRDWLKPEQWPRWGGSMFKEMRRSGPVQDMPALSGETQTHANYLEVVELGGHQLETMLHCDIKTTPRWSAMTYELDYSSGDMLQVDRGYLMALDTGAKRLVKALKVVGFTDTRLNTFATTMCPEWGIWVRRATAVAGAVAETGVRCSPPLVRWAMTTRAWPARPETARTCSPQATPSTGPAPCRTWPPSTASTPTTSGSGSGREPTVGRTPPTTPAASICAWPDWSQAWQAGLKATANWSEADVPPTPGAGPTGRRGRTVEYTTLLVPPRPEATPVSISELKRVGRRAATVSPSAITVTPTSVGPDQNSVHVRIQVDTTDLLCGLYEGSLVLGGLVTRVPALFYVSHARPGA